MHDQSERERNPPEREDEDPPEEWQERRMRYEAHNLMHGEARAEQGSRQASTADKPR